MEFEKYDKKSIIVEVLDLFYRMQKKEILIVILQRLMSYWDLSEGFLLLIQNTDDSVFIDELRNTIISQIKLIQDENIKQHIGNQIQAIKNIKLEESQDRITDNTEADAMIDALFDAVQ